MAMANMNLIGAFVTKLWPVQSLALACGGGRGGGGGDGAKIFKFRGYSGGYNYHNAILQTDIQVHVPTAIYLTFKKKHPIMIF